MRSLKLLIYEGKDYYIFRAREAALSQQPDVEIVKEEAEEEVPPIDGPHKDHYGQTKLHKLVAQSNADLARLSYMGYSPAERDLSNTTAWDIAEENQRRENVEAIGKKNVSYIMQNRRDHL